MLAICHRCEETFDIEEVEDADDEFMHEDEIEGWCPNCNDFRLFAPVYGE